MQARVDTHLRAGTTRAYASRKSSRQISTSSKVLARSRHATDGARVGGVRALLGEHDWGRRLWNEAGSVSIPLGMGDACLGKRWAVTWDSL